MNITLDDSDIKTIKDQIQSSFGYFVRSVLTERTRQKKIRDHAAEAIDKYFDSHIGFDMSDISKIIQEQVQIEVAKRVKGLIRNL